MTEERFVELLSQQSLSPNVLGGGIIVIDLSRGRHFLVNAAIPRSLRWLLLDHEDGATVGVPGIQLPPGKYYVGVPAGFGHCVVCQHITNQFANGLLDAICDDCTTRNPTLKPMTRVPAFRRSLAFGWLEGLLRQQSLDFGCLGDGIVVWDISKLKHAPRPDEMPEPLRWIRWWVGSELKHLRGERSLPAGRYYIGLPLSFDMCPVCELLTDNFQHELPDRVCSDCAAKRMATTHPDPVEDIKMWYRQQGNEMSAGNFELEPDRTGYGRHELQLSHFDPIYDIRVIWDSFGDRCAYCGNDKKELTIDHMVPQSRGGHDVALNFAPACRNCNSRKHARRASDFLKLLPPLEHTKALHQQVVARECEYMRAFGGLTADEIKEIKRPVMQRMRPPKLGCNYIFVPGTGSSLTGRLPPDHPDFDPEFDAQPPPMDLVTAVAIPKPLHDFACEVRSAGCDTLFTVSWHELRFPRDIDNEWWCY